MHAWLEENCGASGWAMTPSGLRGGVNDAVAIYFLDATTAAGFVVRWCAGTRIETAEGAFRVREDAPAPRVGCDSTPDVASRVDAIDALTRSRSVTPLPPGPAGAPEGALHRVEAYAGVSPMKIPAKCPHRRSGKNWVPEFRREPDALPCCRTSDSSITPFLPKRGPLCENTKHTLEEYRFTWRSSFNGNAVVQIGGAARRTSSFSIGCVAAVAATAGSGAPSTKPGGIGSKRRCWGPGFGLSNLTRRSSASTARPGPSRAAGVMCTA
jgi:hypothetical protein